MKIGSKLGFLLSPSPVSVPCRWTRPQETSFQRFEDWLRLRRPILTHSLTDSFIHPPIHPFIDSSICPPIHPPIQLSIHPLMRHPKHSEENSEFYIVKEIRSNVIFQNPLQVTLSSQPLPFYPCDDFQQLDSAFKLNGRNFYEMK